MSTIGRTTIALALIFAPAAFAQTYIATEGDCGTVNFHVTRGSQPIAADHVSEAYVSLPKQKVTAKPVDGAAALTYTANVTEGAVVMVAVSLKPELSGNETRTEHAKAFVFCGPTPVADWQRTVGIGLELYPQGWNGPRPRLKQGDAMRFIAVEKATNTLLRDLPMQLYRAGGALIASGFPAEGGGMNFPYQEPGRYMVVATHRRPDPRQPEHWLIDTSTLTFDIK